MSSDALSEDFVDILECLRESGAELRELGLVNEPDLGD